MKYFNYSKEIYFKSRTFTFGCFYPKRDKKRLNIFPLDIARYGPAKYQFNCFSMFAFHKVMVP